MILHLSKCTLCEDTGYIKSGIAYGERCPYCREEKGWLFVRRIIAKIRHLTNSTG